MKHVLFLAFCACSFAQELSWPPILPGGAAVENSSDFCTALLEHAHVALVTGDAFGAPGYVRLSFATSMDVIKSGLDALEKFIS